MSKITDAQAKEMGQQIALEIGRITEVMGLMSRIAKEVLLETYPYDVTVRTTHKNTVVTLALTNRYSDGSILHDTTAYAIIAHVLSRDTFTDNSLHTEWLVNLGKDELEGKDVATFTTAHLLTDTHAEEYRKALSATGTNGTS